MDGQRFAIAERVFDAEDPQLQEALARVYESPSRPRCLCVPGGVEMYVAHHRLYLVKRMPETGDRHHPACPSFEPGPAASGLGELVGEAIVQVDPEHVELRVEFPWTRVPGHGVARGEGGELPEVVRPKRRLSLRALMHFLFERAGFNRWSPAMAGKRNQAVLHKYLMQAAEGVLVAGEPLGSRLYVPEAFSEERKGELAERRRSKLSVLQPQDGRTPLAVVLGEFKACDASMASRRIWVRHMPDAPLLVEGRTWMRIERAYAALFEARDADGGAGLRLMLGALIRARRDSTYEVEAATLMLLSKEWIPLEGVHELPLIHALVSQQRRFVKPLRYDAACSAVFANALLLDAGPAAVPLHVLSPFMRPSERRLKERVMEVVEGGCSWAWRTEERMPAIPAARPHL